MTATKIQWLQSVDNGVWAALGAAFREGLPVPNGFVVEPHAPEQDIRNAYEELKRVERTHFATLRSPSHALLDILGNDMVMHTLRRLWAEDTHAPILIQRMVHSEWSGKAAAGRNLLVRIKANEGLLMFDPDTYLFNRVTGKCTRRTLQKNQRKMIRRVDGTSMTIQSDDRHKPLGTEQLAAIADLLETAGAVSDRAGRVEAARSSASQRDALLSTAPAVDITWALDDRRVWLIGITRS